MDVKDEIKEAADDVSEKTKETVRHIKRLRRSRNNRILFGVAGGLGEFFGIDATLFRILFVLVTLAGGAGIILYLIAALVMPLGGSRDVGAGVDQGNEGGNIRIIFGAMILVLGVLWLIGQVAPITWWDWDYVWPIVVIVIGLLFLFRR